MSGHKVEHVTAVAAIITKIFYIISANLLCIDSNLLLKSKVAGMAVFLAIDYALCAAFNTDLFVINSRI